MNGKQRALASRWRCVTHLASVGQGAPDPFVVVEETARLCHNLAKGLVKPRVARQEQHSAILRRHFPNRGVEREGGRGGMCELQSAAGW